MRVYDCLDNKKICNYETFYVVDKDAGKVSQDKTICKKWKSITP